MLSLTEKQKKRLSAGLLILALVVMGAMTWLVGRPMVRFAGEPEIFRAWVEEKGIWGRLLFLGMMLFQVVVALIPGEPLEITAGYAFGVIEGTLLCMLATTVGGALVFLLVRKWGVRVLELFFQKERIESLKFMQNTPKIRVIAFFLMFLPGTPKDLLSYFMGLTKIRLSEWLVLSTVARIPSIVTSTVGGNALGGQNYTLAIIVFAVTLVISLLGGGIYTMYTRRHKSKEAHQ